MTPSRDIEIVHAHAEGEVGDVIISGVDPPPGRSVWEQSRWIAADGRLRDYVLNEPRGGVFRHVNLLFPPLHPDADAAFIIMEPEDTPPMSGSNAMCVATVLLEEGLLQMTAPVTELTLEAPGGLVRVRAECADGKVSRVHVANLPSFVDRLAVPLEVSGHGTLTVDTAFGGDSFVVVDAPSLGLSLTPDEAADIARLGVQVSDAATEAIGFRHPTLPDWRHISFCLFATPLDRGATRHAVAIRPGKIDRSPTGTAVSARLALERAKGRLSASGRLEALSIIGSSFTGRILAKTTLGDRPAIVPEVSGRAWITGRSVLRLDPNDPFPAGYRLSDTWGA